MLDSSTDILLPFDLKDIVQMIPQLDADTPPIRDGNKDPNWAFLWEMGLLCACEEERMLKLKL